MSNLLANQRVFITGGGHGLGRAIAERLALEGAAIAVAGRSRQPLEETATALLSLGCEALAVECDVSDEASVNAAVADTCAALGGIDILVNNAGIAPTAPFHRLDLASWEHTLRVNATGPFLCMKACLPGMLERGFGRVVNVASVAGLHGAPMLAAYTASKHALIGLTRAAAAELGDKGIHVNAVCPGYIDTPMARQGIDRLVARGIPEDDAIRKVLATGGQRRILTANEVADWVLHLAGPASRGMNGQLIVLDGGGA